jgi:hypothetical protein
MKLLGIYLKSLEMESVKKIFQDENDSSQRWDGEGHNGYHPVTPYQMHRDSFKVGDRVRLIFINSNKQNKDYTIREIITYETAKGFIGSYNSKDSFKGEAFTHVLILRS